MNLHSTNSTLSLPSSSRLLPPKSSDHSHPPIYLKLNSNVLELLAQTLTESEVKLLLSDRGAALRINDNEFYGTQYKEPGHVEVYLPSEKNEEPDDFRNFGEISTRVLIKPEKPKKVYRESENANLAPLTEVEIIQLIKSKPQTLDSLQQETQVSSPVLQAILSNVATRTDKGFYVLKSRTQKSRADAQTPGRPPADTKFHHNTGDSVLDDHIAGDSMNGKHDKAVRKPIRRVTQNAQKPSDQSSAALAAAKRKSSGLGESSKKIKKCDSNAEMFELARKFQNAYGEYLELYSVLSKRKTRPHSQVEKLMEMHNQLTQWKKTLWSNSRAKGQVK